MPRASLNNKLNVKKQGMKTEQDYGYKEWEDWFKAVEDGHGGTDLNVLQLDDVSEHGHRAVRHERLHIFLRQRCATISTFFLKCTTERERNSGIPSRAAQTAARSFRSFGPSASTFGTMR